MILTRRTALAAPLALAGCFGAPDLPANGVATGACGIAPFTGADGFDPAKLAEALALFEANNFHGLLVERAGALTLERYRTGHDSPLGGKAGVTAFDPCTLHDVRSISKSVTSLLWGVATGEGLTPPIDTPVLDLYPDLATLKTNGREKMTLRHCLTMTTGLDWNEENYGTLGNVEDGLYWRKDLARYTLDRPLSAAPGTTFNYCGGATAIIADLLTRFTGMSLSAYADARLFQPLGITDWQWATDMRGRPASFSGLRLTPRSLLRIGRLVHAGGQWNGRQIVPVDWIAQSIAPHIETGDGLRYGYFWWLGDVDTLGASHPWAAGFGNGGQRLYVIPTLGVSIAITAGHYNSPLMRQSSPLFRAVAAALV